MITDLMTQSVTLLRPTTTGRDEIGGVETTDTETVVDAYLEHLSGDEVDQNTHPRGMWRLYVAAGTDLHASDRVTYGTHTFEVVAPIREKWNPRLAVVSHIEADLEEVT